MCSQYLIFFNRIAVKMCFFSSSTNMCHGSWCISFPLFQQHGQLFYLKSQNWRNLFRAVPLRNIPVGAPKTGAEITISNIVNSIFTTIISEKETFWYILRNYKKKNPKIYSNWPISNYN